MRFLKTAVLPMKHVLAMRRSLAGVFLFSWALVGVGVSDGAENLEIRLSSALLLLGLGLSLAKVYNVLKALFSNF